VPGGTPRLAADLGLSDPGRPFAAALPEQLLCKWATWRHKNKLATERVVEQSGIARTPLRATQFHDLILMVADRPDRNVR
jgi:hypothetical protein